MAGEAPQKVEDLHHPFEDQYQPQSKYNEHDYVSERVLGLPIALVGLVVEHLEAIYDPAGKHEFPKCLSHGDSLESPHH